MQTTTTAADTRANRQAVRIWSSGELLERSSHGAFERAERRGSDRASAVEQRLALARAIRYSPGAMYVDLLVEMADDQDLEVRRAVGDSGIYVADAPVLAEGRIELLWYLREQSISHDYHRYGNLGERTLD